MSTTNVNLTTTWTLLVTGPTTTTGTISANANKLEVAIDSSAPSADVHGFTVNAGGSWRFDLVSGEKLYGRASSPSGTSVAILNS